jgi:hypothetical protein
MIVEQEHPHGAFLVLVHTLMVPGDRAEGHPVIVTTGRVEVWRSPQ